MDNPTSTAAVSRAKMYSTEDEDTTSSTSEDNVETVRTANDDESNSAQATASAGLLQTIVNVSVSKNEDENIIEEDEADIDEYFNDLFPDRNRYYNLPFIFNCSEKFRFFPSRLDTVEEVTEPMSSLLSLPLDLADAAKISGQPSSDFAGHDSLPPDGKSSMMSVTSREEMYSVSEVEVLATTWPAAPTKTQRPVETTIELSTKGKGE